MKTFLFLLRSYPDVDHIAPVIWKCLEKGDTSLILFDQPYNYHLDYRIQYLLRYPRLQILPLAGAAAKHRYVRVASRILWNQYTLGRFLRRHHVDACFFEWGEGVLKSNGPFHVISNFAKDFRAQLFMAARARGLSVIALPHGLNTKLNIDTSPYVMEVLKANGGELPFQDRNEFTVYVFNTEYHRQSYIRHARFDPNKCATWGSIRFCPQWMAIVGEICPKASFPEKKNGQRRLLFFLPKWHNRLNKLATVGLLESLSKRKEFQILLKTHPRRGEAEVDNEKFQRVISSENVRVAGQASSPALIDGADVVIDIGSSIAVEALLRRRPVIYPFYLHENRLIFDEYGGCLRAGSEQKVHQWLDRILECGHSVLSDAEIAIVSKHAIYGGREPYDVPEYYYEQVAKHLSTMSPN